MTQSQATTGTFSVEEAAQRLGVPAKAVYRLLARGVLDGQKTGRVWRVTMDSLFRFQAAGTPLAAAEQPDDVAGDSLFDDAVTPLLCLALDGTILRANPAALELTGFDRAALVGRNIVEVAVEPEPAVEIIGRLAEGDTLRDRELQLRRADGTDRWIALDAGPVRRDGVIVHALCACRDITDAKRLEMARRRLGEAFRHAGFGLALVGPHDDVLVAVNEAFATMHGSTAVELAGRPLHELVQETERPRLLEHAARANEHGRYQYECEHLRGDDASFPTSVDVTTVRDDAGEPLYRLLYVQDITERRREEEERRAHARLLALSAAVGVALTHRATLSEMLHDCAQALVDHLGAAFARVWTHNEVAGVLELAASAGLYTHLDGAHGRVPVGMYKIGRIAEERRPHLTNQVLGDPRVSDQEWARREGMVAFAGYPLVVEDRLAGVVALFSRQVLSDDVIQALGAVADSIALGIERKRAEAVLHEHVEVVETIAGVGRALSAELDLQKLVQAVTDAATELTGAQFGAFFYNVIDRRGESYTLYTISGVPREEFSRFPMPRNTDLFGPTFRGEGVIRLTNVREDDRYGHNQPYRGMPSGHLPVTSYLAVPVVARSGEVLGGLFFGHADAGVFTEREEKLAVGLAAQAAVAIDNARLYGAARDALRTRDEFIGAISHDLRTPLATMRGLTQLLLRQADRAPQLESDRVAHLLGEVERAAVKMNGMIDELLDLTRVETGRLLDLRLQSVDLVALVQQLAADHQRTTAHHRIVVAATVETLTGRWDAGRLERVISNLLSNAVKYSPDGGEIDVTVQQVAEGDGAAWAEVSVRDHGIGIPALDLPHIFERFHRAVNVTGKIKGAGIGLASAKQIVEQHGGTLLLQSTEGEGSTFIVRLPLHAPAGESKE